ncbi:MAG: TIGR03086 family protein [SAR202 cluster bacterium]|nr:TIGR03086 family protein [SAR202 cluster bacterium]
MATANNGELYLRALRATRKFVANIKPDQWRHDTPCTDWDLRTVLNHLVNENRWAAELFGGNTIANVGHWFDGDLLGDDPLKAYDDSVAAAAGQVGKPGAMIMLCDLSRGPTPGHAYAGELFLDALIHGWDIAKGSRQDATLDPALVRVLYDMVVPQVAELRASGMFGGDVPVAVNADTQTKLLALLGRRASWPR